MSESEGSGAGQREVAYRIFAAEFEAADYDYSESDEERAPNYVITPTGARANRLFIVGVLTEIEQVSEDVLRARVVDPTGAFVLYAGQYQPDEQAFLEQIQPPTFVAVTGKARTFQPDDSDQIFTSVRPESISEVDDETRDRWTVQTAEQTIDRIRWMTTALATESEDVRADLRRRGADGGLAHGIELALDHYGTTPTYLDALRDLSLDAARVVAGEADEVEEFGTAPDTAGDVTVADLAASFTLPEADEQSETTTPSAGDEQPTAETDESEAATASVDDGVTASSEEVSTESDAGPAGDGTAEEPASATESEESAEPTADAAEEPVTEEPTESDTAEPATEMTEEPPASEDTAAEPEADASAAEPDELGDFEPEEFELEEETREEIEEEYGTEFQSGTEIDEPGSADIDTPDPADVDGPDEEPADAEPVEDAPDEPSASDESDPLDESADAEPEPEEPEPVDDEPEEPEEVESSTEEADDEETGGDETETVEDPQQAVVDLMGELDDGDGAAREELVAEMGDRYGTDSETVEDAIQSALMEGQCYEPDDEHLKPI